MCWIGCSWLAGEPVTRQVETRRDPDVLWALANDPQPAASKQLLQGVMLVWLEAVHDFVRALIADVADPALQRSRAGKPHKTSSVIPVTLRASAYWPSARPMPSAATSQIVAAVVRPITLPRSRRMTPAPRKPTPLTMFAAMRGQQDFYEIIG